MKQLLRVRLLCGVFTLCILANGASTAHANHPWGTYHWAHTSTDSFPLPVGDNTTGDWQEILSLAITGWASLAGNDISTTGSIIAPPWSEQEIIPQLVIGTAGKACKTVTGTTQVCNKSYGANGWLGLATIYLSGNHITKGTAKVNDTYFSTATYNNPNEKRHVVCQEVAHTFGLGHQSEDGTSLNTCMDYYSNTGANAGDVRSTIPNYHDYEQLSLIYNAHTDSVSSVSSTAKALATQADTNASDDDNPRQWGQLLHQSTSGRSSVYEQTLENGNKIVRHVLWTEETAAKCPACDHRFHDKD